MLPDEFFDLKKEVCGFEGFQDIIIRTHLFGLLGNMRYAGSEYDDRYML